MKTAFTSLYLTRRQPESQQRFLFHGKLVHVQWHRSMLVHSSIGGKGSTMTQTEKSLQSSPLGPVLLIDNMMASLLLSDTAARGRTATGWENLRQNMSHNSRCIVCECRQCISSIYQHMHLTATSANMHVAQAAAATTVQSGNLSTGAGSPSCINAKLACAVCCSPDCRTALSWAQNSRKVAA